MTAWRLLAILALMCVAHVAAAQDAPTVFRSDTYVVALDLHAKRQAMPGLTSDDFAVVLDKDITAPVTLVSDPTRPGFYRLTFSPPDSLRDGKKHRVAITLVSRPKRKVRLQMKFERVAAPSDGRSSDRP